MRKNYSEPELEVKSFPVFEGIYLADLSGFTGEEPDDGNSDLHDTDDFDPFA